MNFTQYFMAMRQRPDRAMIELAWIQRVIDHPEKETIQQDGRTLRVILLPDGETVHNAFLDRDFEL